MLISAIDLPIAEDRHDDVLIVGAGAVGLALGIRLCRCGFTVTIVEAGPEHPSADFQRRNAGGTAGVPHRGLAAGRMKALGGTTRLWGGQLVPFSRADIEGDEAAGRPAWPLSYDDLSPFFDEAYDFLGVASAARDQEAVWRRATGLPADLGENLRLGMNLWLPQPDFARLFSRDINTLPGLRVVTEAEVQSLEMDGGGRVIVGCVIRRADGSLRRMMAPTVVLANGTFEIVKLLLRLAAREPTSALGRNSNIGRGFIDHLHCHAADIRVADIDKLRLLFDNIYYNGLKFSVKIRSSDLFRTAGHLGNCAATINASYGVRLMLHDGKLLARRVMGGEFRNIAAATRHAITMARIMLPMAWRYLVKRRSTSLVAGRAFLGLELEQLPTERSFISLDPSVSPEIADVVLQWGFDGREVQAAAALCDEVDRQFAAQGIGRLVIDPRIVARDPAFLESCHDANHQMGGARMAADAVTGVVDADLKVFETDNLYVLGAAVYPSGSFANPTFTALALAMRLAAHIETGKR